MAICEIKKMGNPVLRREADTVPDPTAPEIKALVEDMFNSMRAASEIGIAAPQIGVSKQVMIFHVPDEDAPGNDPETRQKVIDNPLTVLVNPEIEVLDETMEEGWEGCLSVPGLTGLVPRYKKSAIPARPPKARRSSASPPTSMPGSSSMSSTIFWACSIRTGCAATPR